ncbi:carboxy terminal-processing peptidase [Hydrocarboniclastica marina]|nr:carboxy terminal-processing peptidase [Hydrocarboniclastica marina]|tara:strand:- start:5784 stop:7979 length:2196 start_codon:yes stop_codon:yes gene_type:complete
MMKARNTASNAFTHRFSLLFAALALGLFFGVIWPAPLTANNSSTPGTTTSSEATFSPVQPTVEQSRASILIARQLQFTHFRDQNIDDVLSGRIYEAYLDSLDSQRLYLTRSDIDEFEPLRTRMDDALKTGRLDPAFMIYNRYQKRMIERLEFVVAQLEQGLDKFDFSTRDTLQVNREDQPWAKDADALDTLWRKRLMNQVLGMKLNGKDDEEIADSLMRRYKSQLNRAYQGRSEDAFQTWMNAFTGVWDPHTNYFSPQVSENFNINMSLSLEGIGAVLQSDNEYTKVVRLVPGGPASSQGQLSPADRIIGVGEGEEGEMTNVIGWRLDEVVDLIRGPKDSKVRLEVLPSSAADDSVAKEVVITRDQVKLEEQAAQSHMLELERNGKDWKVGVITIPTFYADFQAMQAGDPNYRSTTRDVQKLLEELKDDGMDALVIDLRDNGGGALQEANSLVGLFIEQGPTVQIRSPDNDIDVMGDPDNEVVWDGPMISLVNRMSASASEIFAGAIQDYNRGLVMGSQTFGKGTVQAIRPLNHGQLKITQSKFYRVSGDSTQHRGVLPDIVVPSLIDKEEIGEDALDYALPWDQIDAVEHKNYFDFQPVLEDLKTRHETRIAENPFYQLLLEEIALRKEQRARDYVSLNSADRKSYQTDMERRQLRVINTRRELENKEPFEDIKGWEEHQEERMANPNGGAEPDFVSREAGEIMADLLELSKHFASINTPDEAVSVLGKR